MEHLYHFCLYGIYWKAFNTDYIPLFIQLTYYKSNMEYEWLEHLESNGLLMMFPFQELLKMLNDRHLLVM